MQNQTKVGHPKLCKILVVHVYAGLPYENDSFVRMCLDVFECFPIPRLPPVTTTVFILIKKAILVSLERNYFDPGLHFLVIDPD